MQAIYHFTILPFMKDITWSKDEPEIQYKRHALMRYEKTYCIVTKPVTYIPTKKIDPSVTGMYQTGM